MVQTKKVFCSKPYRKVAPTDAEPEGCPQDLLSSDVMYFGRTLLSCVIEGSSPHTQTEGQAMEPQYPSQRHKTLNWAGAVPGEPHGQEITAFPGETAAAQLTSQLGEASCLGMGHMRRCGGRSAGDSTRPGMG